MSTLVYLHACLHVCVLIHFTIFTFQRIHSNTYMLFDLIVANGSFPTVSKYPLASKDSISLSKDVSVNGLSDGDQIVTEGKCVGGPVSGWVDQ